MFVRTLLTAGFIFCSLVALGCRNQSAPAAPQPAAAPAGQPTGVQYLGHDDVSDASAPRIVDRTPRPSVVHWVGPAPESTDQAIAAEWPPSQPGPAVDQPVALAPYAPPVARSEQPIAKPVEPAVPANPQPAPAVVPKPPVVKPPVVAMKPATMPAVIVQMPVKKTVVQTTQESPHTVAKIAKATTQQIAINSDQPRPKTVVILPPPATKRATPEIAINTPKPLPPPVNVLPRPLLNAVSFESVLEMLPKDYQPLANVGWDQFAIGKALQWINQQLAGAEMRVSVEITSVELIRIPNASNPINTDGWEVALTTKPESFRSFGIDTFHWPATWTVDVAGKRWRGGDVSVAVTEDIAKQARLWKAGDTIVLAGKVQGVVIEGGSMSSGQPCGKFTTVFADIHVEKVVPQSNRS